MTVYCHCTWSHEETEMVPHPEGDGNIVCPECGTVVRLDSSASTSSTTGKTEARYRNPPTYYGVEGVPGMEESETPPESDRMDE